MDKRFTSAYPIEEDCLLPETVLAAQFIPPGINVAHMTSQSVLLKFVACFLAITY